MNNKQRQTLAKKFEQPERVDTPWADIEKLFKALGFEVAEGRGLRARVSIKGRKAVFSQASSWKGDKQANRSLCKKIS